MIYSPHKVCLNSDPAILWSWAAANSIIFLIYVLIPVLITFIQRKNRIAFYPYRKVINLFKMFTFACGITHLNDVITLWYPYYYYQVTWAFFTAAVSVYTAYQLREAHQMDVKVYKLHGNRQQAQITFPVTTDQG